MESVGRGLRNALAVVGLGTVTGGFALSRLSNIYQQVGDAHAGRCRSMERHFRREDASQPSPAWTWKCDAFPHMPRRKVLQRVKELPDQFFLELDLETVTISETTTWNPLALIGQVTDGLHLLSGRHLAAPGGRQGQCNTLCGGSRRCL